LTCWFTTGAHDLVDCRVERAEPCVEIGDLLGRGAQRHTDLEVGRLLVIGIGVHLVPGIGHRLDADLLHAVHHRQLEAEAGLGGANDRAVAQQDAALGLVDRVPTAEQENENDNAADGGDGSSSDHGDVPGWR
jgi:hypothetical protein